MTTWCENFAQNGLIFYLGWTSSRNMDMFAFAAWCISQLMVESHDEVLFAISVWKRRKMFQYVFQPLWNVLIFISIWQSQTYFQILTILGILHYIETVRMWINFLQLWLRQLNIVDKFYSFIRITQKFIEFFRNLSKICRNFQQTFRITQKFFFFSFRFTRVGSK